MLKGILRNPTPPEWKEADEIVRHVWLGTITDNEHARRRKITRVICISKDPNADLKRESFKTAPDVDIATFTQESDAEGDLLPILGDVCDFIDSILEDGKGVLVLDVGGGVAALAAYIMRKGTLCLPEAMTVITRARFKRQKPTRLPSQRIIDLLHNDNYILELEIWQVCKYDMYKYVLLNPSEPREKWMVERVDGRSEEKSGDVQPRVERLYERFPRISGMAHRLSTIEEGEEEAQRLSTSTIEEEAQRLSTSTIQEEAQRLSTSTIEEEAQRLSTSTIQEEDQRLSTSTIQEE